MLYTAAKISVYCLEMGQYIFTDEILKRHLKESDVLPEYLSKLGPVEFVDEELCSATNCFKNIALLYTWHVTSMPRREYGKCTN